jgi:hypothetical protein
MLKSSLDLSLVSLSLDLYNYSFELSRLRFPLFVCSDFLCLLPASLPLLM